MKHIKQSPVCHDLYGILNIVYRHGPNKNGY